MNSVERDDKICDMYTSQVISMQKVADSLGVSAGLVHKVIHERGIKPRNLSEYPVSEKLKESAKIRGERRRGYRMSEESKKKISDAHKVGGVGHRKRRQDGYIAIWFPDHPKATKEGYIMEHVLVMEALIGRHLNEDECVHHINFKRDDNRKENLKLMTKSEHMSYHMKKRHADRRDDLSTL